MARTVVSITFNNFDRIAARLPVATGERVQRTLLTVQGDIREMMAGPKSGRAYGDHIASAPGEAPAIDTGALANSIQTEMDSQTSGAVYTNSEYAAYLEFGTSKMAPRPSFTPAAEAARADFVRSMQDLERDL